MKRINIYITEETDRTIDNLSEIFDESRSEVIRKAIDEYSAKHKGALDEFITDLDDFDDSPINPTERWKIEELEKCQDINYFMSKYVKIRTADSGLVRFEPRKYQSALAQVYSMYRWVIVNQARQMGMTTLNCAYILHYLLFNTDKTVAILSPKLSSSEHIIHVLKDMMLELPAFLKETLGINIDDNKPPTETWNKRRIRFANGNYVLAACASPDGIRGMSINLLYLDQFAFIPKYVAEEFMASIFPTLACGNSSQIIISSSANGPNHFYKMWTDAISDYLDFHPVQIDYTMHEDEDIKAHCESMRLVLGEDRFKQEYECQFLVKHRGLLHGV